MTRSAAASLGASEARYEIDIATPYRLDLTVSALRRLSTNIVDVLTPGGEYVRILDGFRRSVIVRVSQTQPARLMVVLQGCGSDEHTQALALVRRILGVERVLSGFYRAAEDIPWLWPLAVRMRGIKPPRYPTLWEACVNAIVFQQMSLFAASSIARRTILALGAAVTCGGTTLHAFPGAEIFQAAKDDILLAAGLSANKLSTLRRAADALLSDALNEAMLQERSSEEGARLLCSIKGIGPWTATVILLRGLGRLDVFPMNDSSVARNLAFVAGAVPLDIDRVLTALGPQRGMLYYHLLLARLDARGEIGRASHGSEELTDSE